MLTYWIMFFVPALSALLLVNSPASGHKWLIIPIAIFFMMVVGFRYEIGCDWGTYLDHFYNASTIHRMEDMQYASKDIGYGVLNIAVAKYIGSIWGVNLFVAIVCMSGLALFCMAQPSPLLALTIAVPYIVIVLFQGYTRQAAAFGFELFALVALSQVKYKKFALYILFAASFHKTATILFPLAALASTRNKLWTYFWVGITSLSAFFFFLAEYQEILWETYVVANYESSGGGIRIAMNVVPSVLFLIFRNRFTFASEEEKKIWLWISLLSLVCIPLVSLSSTAVDRIALYLMPIQIYVFCRLPGLFEGLRGVTTAGIVFYYFLVQFVWLNYASHAHCWVPYNFQLFYQTL